MSATVSILLSAQNQASAAIKNVDGDLRALKKTGKDVGQGLKDFGGALSLGVTAPIIAFGGAAMKAITDLNAGLANVGALGIGEERLQQLKDDIQSIGIETGKMTGDLSNGLYQVISAFGDTADTADILRINAKAAAAGLAETTDAINLTSAVTKAYGDTSAAAVQKTADLALATVRLGQTTFPELASAIGKVTPIAAALGVTQTELFAQMATLTGVTGSAAEVSTQLRAAYQSLLAPTKDMSAAITDVAGKLDAQGKLAGGQFTDAWREARQAFIESSMALGTYSQALTNAENATKPNKKAISELKDTVKNAEEAYKEAEAAYAAAGAAMGSTLVQSVGLNDAMKLLSGTAGGNTDQLTKMFGSVEALTAVLALSGGQADAFEAKLADMQKVSGETNAAFDAQTQGINKAGFAIQQAKVKFEVFLQKIGDGLAPVILIGANLLGRFGDVLLSLGNSFANLAPATQTAIVAMASIAAAIGPVMYGVGWLITAFSQGGVLIVGLEAVGAALAALLSPIVLVTAGVALLAVAIYKDWGGIGTYVREAMKPAVAWVSGLSSAIQTLLTSDSFVNLKTSVTTELNSIGTAVKDYFSGDISLGGLAGAVNQGFSGIRDSLARFFGSSSFQNITSAISVTWNGLVASVRSSFAAIDWSGVGKNLLGLVASVRSSFAAIDWSGVGKNLLGLVASVRSSFAAIDWSGVTVPLRSAQARIAQSLAPISLAFSGLKMPASESILTALNGFRDRLITSLAMTVSGLNLSRSLSGILTSITSAISGIDFSKIGFRLGAALSFVLDGNTLRTAFLGAVAGVAPALVGSIAGITWLFDTSKWTGLKDALIRSVMNINWSTVSDAFKGLKESITTALGDFAKGFTAGFQTPEWLTKLMAWKMPEPTALLAWAWPGYDEWAWPGYTAWIWPGLPAFTWPSLPTWTWPSLPSWSWPEIPMPGWWTALFGGEENAMGTSHFAGGTTLVGERGPELLRLPPGSEIRNATETRRMMQSGGMGEGITIIIQNANMNSAQDITRLAYEIDDIQTRRRR